MKDKQYILVRFFGTSLTYQGPFESREEAAEYANRYYGDSHSHIVLLYPTSGGTLTLGQSARGEG